jgi:hypothetical protein
MGWLVHKMAALFVMSDPSDLRSLPMVRSPHDGAPTLYLYDRVPGGIGLGEAGVRHGRAHFPGGAGSGPDVCLCGRMPGLHRTVAGLGRGGEEGRGRTLIQDDCMSATIIDGKQTAETIRAEIKAEVTAAVAKGIRPPGLAVVIVGEDPASQIYVRNKRRAAQECGFHSVAHELAAETSVRPNCSISSAPSTPIRQLTASCASCRYRSILTRTG